jgi:2-methylcitrate dehydratase PrpD
MTASPSAHDGPQGFLAAMDSERPTLAAAVADLGSRWEIVDTGITVKLYPSCAATHPTIDTVLDLRRERPFGAEDVERIEVDVDSVTPNVLIYAAPSTGLEAKFSMPFCAAAAVVRGNVGIDTFEPAALADPQIQSLMPRVTMRVDASFDGAAPPLTQARVTIRLRGLRALTRFASGARGYPASPASDEQLNAKFVACAQRVLTPGAASRALELLRGVDRLSDIRVLTRALGS